jgi:hypothetical protein
VLRIEARRPPDAAVVEDRSRWQDEPADADKVLARKWRLTFLLLFGAKNVG